MRIVGSESLQTLLREVIQFEAELVATLSDRTALPLRLELR